MRLKKRLLSCMWMFLIFSGALTKSSSAAAPLPDFYNPVLMNEEDCRAFKEICVLLEKDPIQDPVSEEGLRLYLAFSGLFPGDRENLVEGRIRLRIDRKVPRSYDARLVQCVSDSYRFASSRFQRVTGLDLPPGMIFIWALPQPSLLQVQWGLAPKTEAATFMARYILVPMSSYRIYAPGRASPFTGPSFSALTTDLSHEFAHVFFNASVGQDQIDLPEWFREGMAVQVARNTSRDVSEEYVRFGRAFVRLQRRMGEDTFRLFMKALAKGMDFKSWLYTLSGYSFFEDIEEEEEERRTLALAAFTGLVILFFATGLLIHRSGLRKRHILNK